MKTAIVWFRRDLRLTDNPAFTAALSCAEWIVPVYIHSPHEESPWPPGAASRWWLYHSLTALDLSLRERGACLIIRQGDSLRELVRLVEEVRAEGVFWNRLYEPQAIARDRQIKAALRETGLCAESHNAALLFEPWQVKTRAGEPYRVFTPFWRSCSQLLAALPAALTAPDCISMPRGVFEGFSLAGLDLLPRVSWDLGFHELWQPGETSALVRLEKFCAEGLAGYQKGRDRPDRASTSRLSPHLHFGEISPRQVLAEVNRCVRENTQPGILSGAEVFLRELGWREFAHHLLYHFPETTDSPFDPRFSGYPWVEDASALRSWQRGETGIPLVDAGMRELWQTGWMHNRVRMVVASFLTKNLRIHWREGARWFWDTLVDADLANNALGWQWTAGCGAVAAPYFRIFNPVLQAERYDVNRDYIRRWIPEVAALPDKYVHRPWTTPKSILDLINLRPGRDYPSPITDLQSGREAALAGYRQIQVS